MEYSGLKSEFIRSSGKPDPQLLYPVYFQTIPFKLLEKEIDFLWYSLKAVVNKISPAASLYPYYKVRIFCISRPGINFS